MCVLCIKKKYTKWKDMGEHIFALAWILLFESPSIVVSYKKAYEEYLCWLGYVRSIFNIPLLVVIFKYMQIADLIQFIENMLTILSIINNVFVFPTCCECIRLKKMPLTKWKSKKYS